MKKILLFLLLASELSSSQDVLAKEFKAQDKSANNFCSYVYKWFKQTKDKHAVFVTTGGFDPSGRHTNQGYCQAGGAATLREATQYAISRCQREAAKRFKKKMRCRVVESR